MRQLRVDVTLETINICFAIDEKFVKPCAVAIMSILKNSNSPFHFYILHSGIDENKKQSLGFLKKIKNFKITFVEVSLKSFEKCYVPPQTHFT